MTPTVKWLADVLLPKIVRWAEENQTMAGKCRRDPLVPLDKFCLLYQRLKGKYGPFFVEVRGTVGSVKQVFMGRPQNWPETTDPHKFVYEDIAIATYLLVSFCAYVC